jgi:hypothetical protein
MKVLTESGLPIDPKNVRQFRLDWRELYDKAQAKCSTGVPDATGHQPVDMVRLNKLLTRLDRLMRNKYPSELTADYPPTPQDMLDLMQTLGAPLQFGILDGELAAILKDGPMGLSDVSLAAQESELNENQPANSETQNV